ncbi:MAG: TonB-dependent receptor [bacterium]
MVRKSLIHTVLFTFLFVGISTAQNRKQANDTLDGQEVNVVKPYSPKVSDAFKVKEIPSTQEEANAPKKKVVYNIFSIPVASTFTPAKGKAAAVEKAKKEALYDNFLSFGAGSFTTLLGELYLNHAINRTENVGGYISHHSSQGDIEGVRLDNNFSDTKIRANYARNLNSYSLNVDAGYRQQVLNWYGLPMQFDDLGFDVNSIEPKQKYFTFDFGGEVEFDDSLIKEGRLRFRRFADDYESSENSFAFRTNFDIPLNDGELNTTVRFDYLNGNFDRTYFIPIELKYGNFIVGGSPSYQIVRDDLTVNLGVSAYYLNDTEAGDSKFFIYPDVTASYRIANEVLIGYAGIKGDLIQNTYHDFAQANPFVSPNLVIMPTDQQYNAYVGLKGKLSNNMSYNIRGTYKAANNQALFNSNTLISTSPETNLNYQFGNSFSVVYDDVSTFSIFGEINVDVNRNFNLGLKAEYFNYSTDNELEAWNLPDFQGSLFLDFQIDEHWFAGASLYYIGERLDQFTDSVAGLSPVITLESYFDANAHLGYRINDRWTVYAKGNNLANQDYQRFANFPVQGIQLLGGVTYKFDF